jgi:hypothetical protein
MRNPFLLTCLQRRSPGDSVSAFACHRSSGLPHNGGVS